MYTVRYLFSFSLGGFTTSTSGGIIRGFPQSHDTRSRAAGGRDMGDATTRESQRASESAQREPCGAVKKCQQPGQCCVCALSRVTRFLVSNRRCRAGGGVPETAAYLPVTYSTALRCKVHSTVRVTGTRQEPRARSRSYTYRIHLSIHQHTPSDLI